MTASRRATPKSTRTRESIATAARERFAAQGFDRTTVRDIAADAGIDPAMVMRYFGSKERLFALVSNPDLGLPDLSNCDPADIGKTLVRHFLQQWEGDGSGLPVLLRSAASNAEAADKLRGLFVAQVAPIIAAAGPPETAALRAGLVASQLLGLATARYVLCLPPVVAMPTETIIRIVGETIQRYVSLEEQ